MRAAIYARVSSSAQREAHTIENQLRMLPAFVASQGWDLIGTYVDDGRSARTGKLDRRDGFAKLVRDATARLFDVLVVADIDRLTRTDDMRERAAILGPFQAAGIRIVTPSGGELDLRTMLGELYVTLHAIVAAEENRKRTERIKAGKARAIAEGRKPSGPTPFGLAYHRATGTWSINPKTGPLVVEIFERVAAGESCLAIADDFDARGEMRPRGRWERHRVWDIVRSRFPVGEWTVDKGRKLVITVPAIVTEELWQRAQQALLKHGKRGLRRTKHTYLLEGLATCSACGSAILIRSASPGRNGYVNPPAYVCRARKLSFRGAVRCDAPIVPCADADARVWAKLSELIQSPKLIEAALEVRRELSDNPHDWKADAESYRRRLAQIDRAEQALVARFSRGTVSEQALDAELARIGRERAALRAQVVTAERAAMSASDARQRLDDAKSTLARLAPLLPNASQEARRELVAMLVAPGAVTFHGREIRFLAAPPAAAASRGEPARAMTLADAAGWGNDHESNQEIRLRIRLVA